MSRGHDRERAVKAKLQDDDWLVIRAAASLGPVDLVAMKQGHRPQLIEVKSTAAGPFHSFGPKDRADLRQLAEWAGADALLAWWPPRGKLRWFTPDEWPAPRGGA